MVEEERLGFFFRLEIYFWQMISFVRALPYFRSLQFLFSLFFTALFYLFRSPFRMLDKDTNPYGETPFFTWDKIACQFGIFSKDWVYDLGSGRGLGVFWLATQVGCKACGVDNHSLFIRRAKKVLERTRIKGVTFIEEDFLKVDLSYATVIYLFGTALSDDMILQMVDRLKRVRKEVKIITVSYPLSEYSSSFITVKQFTGQFTWGKAEIYLNKISCE